MIVEVLPCRKCGTPTASRDSLTGHFPFCVECDAKAWDGYNEQKAQFEALLEQGVDRRMANRILIQRMESKRARELERELVPYERWGECGAPSEAVELARSESSQGVSTGLAFDQRRGWVVLQSSGQGPYLIWQEREG